MTDNAAIFGPTNPAAPVDRDGVRRMGSVFALNADNETLYRQLHADAWPGVIEGLKGAGLQNYSLFIAELAGQKYVIGYFEYVGDDFEASMAALDVDADTRRWLETLAPCGQEDVECGPMERVFFLE
jgi:L-rhamnose mutarotase